jgi:tetratricopeptide (TPR) repeat protein
MFDDELTRTINQIGYFLRSKGLYTEARAVFDSLAKYQPDRIYPLLGRALVNAEQERYREAEQDLRLVLAREPGHSFAVAYLALTLRYLGNPNWRSMLTTASRMNDDNGGQIIAANFLRVLEQSVVQPREMSTLSRLNRLK